jgi:hydrogenase-4 component E
MVLVILTNFMMLGTSRLSACIRAVSLQGIALGGLLLLTHWDNLTARHMMLVAFSIGIKGIAFPVMLGRTLRKINVRREVEPYVGYSVSIIFGILALLLSFRLGARLPVPGLAASSLAVPVAFSTILTGFFFIISRRKALNQVIGYLCAENGIFVFGITAVHSSSIWVELGILLDVLVAVFVMGIAIHHISREFDSIDVAEFSELRD